MRRRVAAGFYQSNIPGEETFDCGHVSLLRRGDKGPQKAPLLDRTEGCAPAIGDYAYGRGRRVGGCLLLPAGRPRSGGKSNRTIAQNIRGTLRESECFKQYT